MERMKKMCLFLVVLACVAPAMAQSYIDWTGAISNDWTNVGNYVSDPTQFGAGTNMLDFDNPATPNPVISSDFSWNAGARFKGQSGSMTAGTAELWCGQASVPSFMLFDNDTASGASNFTFDISGGSFTNWGQVALGNSGASAKGTGWMNLSGDGTATLLRPKFTNITRTGLIVTAGSGFSIADDATLILDGSFIGTGGVATVQAWIDAGYIINPDGEELQINTIQKSITQLDIISGPEPIEVTSTIDCYAISVVPEPATLALLGLGAVLSFRRKRS